MPYNLPTYDTNRISFGPGILFMGIAGTTPTVDVGAVRSGAELSINREKLEVIQGAPQFRVKSFSRKETISLTITGIEWNLDNLAKSVGAGITTTSGAEDTIELGGDVQFNVVALQYQHVTPAGHTILINLWEGEARGESSISFGDDEHEFPMTWDANRVVVDWAGASLPVKQQLVKIIRQKT